MRPTEGDVTCRLTKAEMQLHCRRAVRETREMEAMLKELIEAYDGERGCDTLGVPLINSARMAEIWKAQQKHIPCLQDPPGFQLYTQTGTLKKGGHVLPTYRCARGSTSLENFHLHMNRFIPAAVPVCPPVREDSGRHAGSNPSLGPQLHTDTPQTSQDGAMLCTHQAPQQDTPSMAEEQPSTSSCSTSDDSVGPDNIAGFKAVQDLTGYLFKLKDHSLALSREEAAKIIALWECLSEYDQKHTVYPPRHQVTIPKGRFRATKKNVAPGVESTKRYVCFFEQV
ncbi:uncharacterized protein LOC131972826 [Centropristis striata]|uniref:uncharacterized protein LOC131972826 n=1 Tax=Centropristis striata TaxID=184440 RepID=UPI0027E01C8C|nr:uncharacterized protein LOC131972826 [Centropristis striata]